MLLLTDTTSLYCDCDNVNYFRVIFMKKSRSQNNKIPIKNPRRNSHVVIKKKSSMSFHFLFWLNLFLTGLVFYNFLFVGIGQAINAALLTFFLPLLIWGMKKVIPPPVISNSLIKKFYLPQ